MSLAKLTSISTKTLSLLLERQRLQTLPSFRAPNSVTGPLDLDDDPSNNSNPSNSLHLPQIKRNLAQLRNGIAEMEAREGGESEAATLLRNQYDRMRAMLGPDAAEIPALDEPTPKPRDPLSLVSSPSPQSSAYATPLAPSPAPMPSIGLTASRGVSHYDSARFLSSSSSSSPSSSTTTTPRPPPPSNLRHAHTDSEHNTIFAPYTDDPSGRSASQTHDDDNGDDTGIVLQTQRFIMEDQDQRLDQLSHSINRQHHISLQINDEMDVHMELLQDLESGVDGTSDRMSNARRKLDRVAKGIKENSSVFAIGVLIFVLLVLIIVLKT